MEFQSPGFLLLFLPLVVFVVLIFRGRRLVRNLVLAAASYLFYSGAQPWFCTLLFVSTCIDYAVALLLSRSRDGRPRKALFGLSLTCNLGILGFFKYGGFLFGLSTGTGDLLPPGISFYTFQTLAYTIDVYRRRVEPTRDFSGFLVFVSFLPQLIAGPIERFERLNSQLIRPQLAITVERVWYGMNRLSVGLLMKVFLADPCGRIVDQGLASGHYLSIQESWLISAAFGIQIYADFCGYSHMAIGIASMMGIELSENFNRPYRAWSIQEFWHRWHMTLSQWFRDYLYIPLGGNRKGKARTALNVLITFSLCGLWHGAGWNFVIWGLLHGLLLGVFVMTEGLRKRIRVPRPVGVLITYAFVHVLWAIFRITDTEVLREFMLAMCGLGLWVPVDLPLWDACYVLLSVFLCWLLPDSLCSRALRCRNPFLCGLFWGTVLTAVLSQPEVKTFIYFRF